MAQKSGPTGCSLSSAGLHCDLAWVWGRGNGVEEATRRGTRAGFDGCDSIHNTGGRVQDSQAKESGDHPEAIGTTSRFMSGEITRRETIIEPEESDQARWERWVPM